MDDATLDTPRSFRFAGTKKQFVTLLNDLTRDWPAAGAPIWLGPPWPGGSPDYDNVIAAFRGPLDMSGVSLYKTYGLIRARRPSRLAILEIFLDEVDAASWPDVRPYWARIVESAEAADQGEVETTELPTDPDTGASEKRKHRNSDTRDKIMLLAELREQAIRARRPIPFLTGQHSLCKDVPIDIKTARDAAPKLITNWYDEDYVWDDNDYREEVET